jgi:hypothetical protein
MNVWFLAILILAAIELGVTLALHGQHRKISFFETLISSAIVITLIILAIKEGF